MNAKRSLGSYAVLIAAASALPAALAVGEMYVQGILEGHSQGWRELLWQANEWLVLGALTPLTFFLGRRFPLRGPRLGRTLLVHVGGALVLCVGWATTGAVLRTVLGIGPHDVPFRAYLTGWILTTIPWSFFMYFAVLGCVHAFVYFLEAREREAQSARLAAQVAESRLAALRMQLHPHFLFNSLNAITVLVRDKRTRSAERMLELLSDVLRQVLRTDTPNETSLADEVGFLKQCLAIEQVRFSDRLNVTYAIDEECLAAAVPTFILQPLVENALRHGIAARADAGQIAIGARRENGSLILHVQDDGIGIDSGVIGEGVGLSNTRERLATLYGNEASLELTTPPAGGTLATVRLPYRNA